MFRNSLVRVQQITPRRLATTVPTLSKASIVDLNQRWDTMPLAQQEDIVNKLTERQKLPWKDLTPSEKQAAWYISYGEWGPRRPVLDKGDASYILKGVVFGLGVAMGLFAFTRMFAGEAPVSMNKEWQLKSDEYLKSKNANPWGGYSQVQSK
ncbi:hypothetical protein KAFR_0J01530 [Kazachstania africana CBS 2517]|uniref:Uncharacterized protein n=1 Tax=Kazachstania africana (strain ATCC 22294 / BCRC 22015 / CBS 2517 / CECT 1963 / NBRC 1671 / NRRL Y-8276) TaxID=1071382 RepID=H2B0R9_KAZAF|nr:hypothetical protein KAFR_0J01530 [Kazachstania africana CBS 2517]CCF60219.1 hypothetical protein KAFR_0J01530 [Kazachstania africana CBS 2517]